jgi:diphosphomevalonate decarboxylase
LNLTARPGFTYFQPGTIRAMRIIDDLRASGTECYYTMDAGSNLKVLVQSANVPAVMQRLSDQLPDAILTPTGFGPGISISRLGEEE